jgi:hypothetical protein
LAGEFDGMILAESYADFENWRNHMEFEHQASKSMAEAIREEIDNEILAKLREIE